MFLVLSQAEAKDAHKAAKASYNRLGRELDRLAPSVGEENNSVDGSGSDILDVSSIEQLDNLKTSSSSSSSSHNKRERQRNLLEARFLEAEEEYRLSVNSLLTHINERSEFHVKLLMALRKAFRDVDETLVNTEKTFLTLRREKLQESLVKVRPPICEKKMRAAFFC